MTKLTGGNGSEGGPPPPASNQEGPKGPPVFETPDSFAKKQAEAAEREKAAEVVEAAGAAREEKPDDPATPGDESAEAGLHTLSNGPDRWGRDWSNVGPSDVKELAEQIKAGAIPSDVLKGAPDYVQSTVRQAAGIVSNGVPNAGPIGDMGRMAIDHANGEVATGADPDRYFAGRPAPPRMVEINPDAVGQAGAEIAADPGTPRFRWLNFHEEQPGPLDAAADWTPIQAPKGYTVGPVASKPFVRNVAEESGSEGEATVAPVRPEVRGLRSRDEQRGSLGAAAADGDQPAETLSDIAPVLPATNGASEGMPPIRPEASPGAASDEPGPLSHDGKTGPGGNSFVSMSADGPQADKLGETPFQTQPTPSQDTEVGDGAVGKPPSGNEPPAPPSEPREPGPNADEMPDNSVLGGEAYYLTAEARKFIEDLRRNPDGGIGQTRNMRKMARQNEIEVTPDMSPLDIANALEAKANGTYVPPSTVNPQAPETNAGTRTAGGSEGATASEVSQQGSPSDSFKQDQETANANARAGLASLNRYAKDANQRAENNAAQQPLSQEALDLLNSVSEGQIPDLTNLRRIASQQGIRVDDSATVDSLIAALAEKNAGYVVSPDGIKGTFTGLPRDDRDIAKPAEAGPAPGFEPEAPGDQTPLDNEQDGARDPNATPGTGSSGNGSTGNRPTAQGAESSRQPNNGEGSKPTEITQEEMDTYKTLHAKILGGEDLSPEESVVYSSILSKSVRAKATTEQDSRSNRERLRDEMQLGGGVIDEDLLAEMRDTWKQGDFDEYIEGLKDEVSGYNTRIKDPRYSAAQKQEAKDARSAARKELAAVQKAYEIKYGRKHTTEEDGNANATAQAEVSAITGQAERWSREASAIRGKSLDELENAEIEVGERLSILQDHLSGMRSGTAQYAALQAEINHLKRLKDQVIPGVKAKAAETKTKDEGKTAEDEAKVKQKALEAARRETANSRDLTAMKTETTTRIGTIESRLKAISTQLEAYKDKSDTDPEKKKLLDERNKLWAEETDLRERLREEEAALEAAQKKEKSKLNAETGISKDTIKQLNPEEFAQLVESDFEAAGKYLLTLSRVFPLDAEKHAGHLRIIKDKLLRGGPDISAKDEANFVDGIGDLLIKKGRKAVDMKELNVILSKYPEIRAALAQKMENSEAAKQLKEKYPSRWEKMTKYAKGKPGWLMILILALAGGAFGALKLTSGGGGGHAV